MNDWLSNNILYVGLALLGITILPFFAVMVTSFAKIAVVLSLVRNALGIQQIPSNQVINGLALILSCYIMAPVLMDIQQELGRLPQHVERPEQARQVFDQAQKSVTDFLIRHSGERERDFFLQSAKDLWPESHAKTLKENDFLVIAPAFTVTEMTDAFKIGFMLFLPFLVVDLVVSNLLLALGMNMVTPSTISLPIKLFLFVMVDGWARLVHLLVLSYKVTGGT